MLGMSKTMARELAPRNITVNAIAPGFIDTEMTRNVLGEKGMMELKDRIPMKRLGQPEEIAALVSWLVSNENTYLTAQNIMIDGGFTRV